jgi:hypothetical protein
MILENENWEERNAFFRGRTETSEESPGVNAGQANRRVGGLAYSKNCASGWSRDESPGWTLFGKGRQPLSLEADRQVRQNLTPGRSPWLQAIFESRL